MKVEKLKLPFHILGNCGDFFKTKKILFFTNFKKILDMAGRQLFLKNYGNFN
jgi:hypothetical protein